MAALRDAPKRCGKHTIPEPFRMRNMASLGVAVEGRKGRTQTLARLATPCSVWRNADVETAGNGAVFVGCSCEIPRGWELVDALPGGQWVAAAEQARVVGGAMGKSRKSSVGFGRGLSSAWFALPLEQGAN